jgi:hypothetical protein
MEFRYLVPFALPISIVPIVFPVGAVHLGGNKMAIFEENAQKLIDNYYKGE